VARSGFVCPRRRTSELLLRNAPLATVVLWKVCGRLYGRTYGSYSRRKLHRKVIGHPRLSVRS